MDELFALHIGISAAEAAFGQCDRVAVLVQLRRTLALGGFHGKDSGEFLYFELDRFRCCCGDLRRIGQHGSHAVADKTDVTAEERFLVHDILADANATAIVFSVHRIFKRQYRSNAWHRKCGGGVDRFDDPVGNGTEHELHVQHVRQLHVTRVAQKAAGLGTGIVDRRALADVLIVHNGFSQNVYRDECSRKMRRQNPLLIPYNEPQPSKERQEKRISTSCVKKILSVKSILQKI